MNANAQYDDESRAGLQRIYGTGFTSPGGLTEMTQLLDGLDLTGKDVMDLGCGLGGDSLLLAGEFVAASVISVDVDPGNLKVTSDYVADADLGHIITPTLVEPGPLPFANDLFDGVHSKAMLCHLDDLAPMFQELRRVLKPDGTFFAADWMKGERDELSQSYHDFLSNLASAGLEFFFRTPQAHADALVEAGFENVELRDATPVVEAYARNIVEQVTGNARDDLAQSLGEGGYEAMVARNQSRLNALTNGDLKFQYIKAMCPA